MAWCHQVTSHYLSHCWLRSALSTCHMTSLGHNELKGHCWEQCEKMWHFFHAGAFIRYGTSNREIMISKKTGLFVFSKLHHNFDNNDDSNQDRSEMTQLDTDLCETSTWQTPLKKMQYGNLLITMPGGVKHWDDTHYINYVLFSLLNFNCSEINMDFVCVILLEHYC